MRYVVGVMEARGGRLGHRETLVQAGRALLEYQGQQSALPRRLTLAQAHNLLGLYKRFVSLAEEAGIDFTPKFHLFAHMVHRCDSIVQFPCVKASDLLCLVLSCKQVQVHLSLSGHGARATQATQGHGLMSP